MHVPLQIVTPPADAAPAAPQAKASAVMNDKTARFILKGPYHANDSIGPLPTDAKQEPLLWQIAVYQRDKQP